MAMRVSTWAAPGFDDAIHLAPSLRRCAPSRIIDRASLFGPDEA